MFPATGVRRIPRLRQKHPRATQRPACPRPHGRPAAPHGSLSPPVALGAGLTTVSQVEKPGWCQPRGAGRWGRATDLLLTVRISQTLRELDLPYSPCPVARERGAQRGRPPAQCHTACERGAVDAGLTRGATLCPPAPAPAPLLSKGGTAREHSRRSDKGVQAWGALLWPSQGRACWTRTSQGHGFCYFTYRDRP